jgi:hypothetical protein
VAVEAEIPQPITTKGREPDVTNPNDIIDAYEELKRLHAILGGDTLQQLIDRIAMTPYVMPVNEPEPSPPVRLVSEPDSTDGCPWCSEEVNARKLYRHVITRHRDDLEEVYADDGVKGIQETFTLNYQTAYGWAQRMTGEAA